MYSRKKLLKPCKAFFSFDLYQRIFVPLPRFMPVRRNWLRLTSEGLLTRRLIKFRKPQIYRKPLTIQERAMMISCGGTRVACREVPAAFERL
jgi:hypothetical protein